MNKSVTEKRARIKELERAIQDAEQEIERLLTPEKEVIVPPTFSLNDEALQIIKEAGSIGITARQILQRLRQKFPDYDIQRPKLASSLAYLKSPKKKLVVGIGRGAYRFSEYQ